MRTPLRRIAFLGATLSVVGAMGCAPKGTLQSVDPVRASYELDAARAAFEKHPNDDKVRLRYGVALHDAGQFAEAFSTLDPLMRKPNVDRRALLYHAAAAEQLNRYEVARTEYTRYLTVAGDSPEVIARLAGVKRREARTEASAALAREQSLNVASIPAASVTVTPFQVATTDTTLTPLGYGLADLLLTDLARSRSLQVVERLRVDALLHELELGSGGRVEQASAPRVGRLVGARRIISGTVSGVPQGQVTLNAQVTDVQTDVPVGQGVTTQTSLNDILAAEKTLVFRVFDQLNVTLTPAERAAIAEQPTRYLQAFLAYSRGVQAESKGNLTAASAEYAAAMRIDPNFRLAAQAHAGVQTPGSQSIRTAQLNSIGRLHGVLDAVNPSPASLLGNIRERGGDAANAATSSTMTILIIPVSPTPTGGKKQVP